MFSTDFIFRQQENLVDNQKYVRLDATKYYCYKNLNILKKITLLRMLIIFNVNFASICLVLYDLAHDHKVKEALRLPLHAHTSLFMPDIITCGLYIFYPIFKSISLFSRRFFQKITG